MSTPAEQKALTFIVIVILLGGAARLLAANPGARAVGESAEFEQHAARVESLAVRKRGGRRPTGAKVRLKRSNGGVDEVAGVVGVPPSDARPDAGARVEFDRRGFPPPSARIEASSPGDNRSRRSEPGTSPSLPQHAAAIIDVDLASEEQLTALPRVGPALARRIVASRDSLGPFGSLSALGRVRGMGPATLELLRPRVTFSGPRASTTVRSRYY